MAVIARYECRECGSAETINTKGLDGPWCGHHPAAGVEWIEYVPASHHRGAVSRAEVAERALMLACEDGWVDAAAARDGYLRAALDAVGGQYETTSAAPPRKEHSDG